MNTISVFFLLLSFASSTPNIEQTHINALLDYASSTTHCENNENTEIIAREILKNARLFHENDVSPDLPFKIACAESRYKNVPNYNYHKNPNYWSAFGIFQFTKTTYNAFCEGNRMKVEDNIKCGVKMIAEGRLSHWSESKLVWLQPQESP